MNYEKKNIQDIVRRNKQIEKILNKAYKDISKRFTTVKGKRFAKVLQKEIAQLRIQLRSNIKKGIKQHWTLGNKKGDAFTDGYLQNIKISETLYKSFRNPNLDALNTFLARTEKGMNLSKRVWKITNTAQKQMEEFLASGVTVGKSSVRVSKDLNRYMNGKGVQYKGTLLKGANVTWQAIRLAITETNMAFRLSEETKMQKLPFVTGSTIHLSASHPRMDICDDLTGDYSRNFIWGGWHPVCICYRTWKKLPKKDFVKFMKTGRIAKWQFISKVPPKMSAFLKKNTDSFKGYIKRGTEPYWIQDNFTKDLKIRKSVVDVTPPGMELIEGRTK